MNAKTGKVLGHIVSEGGGGSDYRLDSSLFIVNPTYINHPDERYVRYASYGSGLKTEFYRVENDQIIKIKELDLTKIQKPKERIEKIIYVGQRTQDAEGIKKICRDYGLSCQTILYTGRKSFNKERVDLQFETLKKNHKWLSDGEADSLLKTQKEKVINLRKAGGL